MSLLKNLVQSTPIELTGRTLTLPALINFNQIRFRKAVHFRKYVQPHYKQKLLLAMCEPVMPRDRRSPAERCHNLIMRQPRPDHPYDVLLARDFAAEIESSELCCILHQNQMDSRDRRAARISFAHEELALRIYNRDIARIALADTKYAPLLKFAVGYNFTVLMAPDLTKIAKIPRLLRSFPELLLLGALVERRRLVTVSELAALAKVPTNIGLQHALLAQTLVTAQQRLVGTLGHHSSQLARLLEQRSKSELDEA